MDLPDYSGSFDNDLNLRMLCDAVPDPRIQFTVDVLRAIAITVILSPLILGVFGFFLLDKAFT